MTNSRLVMIIMLGLLCDSAAFASPVGGLMRRGNGHFARGEYEEALAAYQRAVVLEPDAGAIRFNTGNALHRLGRYDGALRELELALIDKQPERRADALYNIGNTFYRAGGLEQATAAYRRALIENPDDLKAKQNLEFVLKQLEEQQQQPPDDTEDPDPDQPPDESEDQPQPQPDEQALDPEEAERLMQQLERLEREQQEKQHQPRRQRQVEIDW